MNTKHFNKSDKQNALWLGSIAGDAFVLGGHWIYDLDTLAERFPDYSSPQAPWPDTYHKNKRLGDQTHYGDQARHLWQFLADNDGKYSPEGYRQAWLKYIAGYAGYMDKATKESLISLRSGQEYGSDSLELGGTARLAAIYYWVDDEDAALSAAIDQCRVTHDSINAIAITAFIGKTLSMILAGDEKSNELSVFELLDKVRGQMNETKNYNMQLINSSFDAAAGLTEFSAGSIAEKMGQSCNAKQAWPAILAVLKATDDYVEAMKLNVMIGGDSAARALILGALIGAKQGMAVIPEAWTDVMRD